jgi:hypothetical protein
VALAQQPGAVAGVEADPVVADPQPDRAVGQLVDGHRHAAGPGVLGHVGQRLLDDAGQDRLQLRGQPPVQPQGHVDGGSVLPLEPLGVLVQGLGEAAVVEHGRSQGAHQVAQDLGLLAQPLLDALQDLVGALELAITASDPARPSRSASRLRAR